MDIHFFLLESNALLFIRLWRFDNNSAIFLILEWLAKTQMLGKIILKKLVSSLRVEKDISLFIMN